ncbi:transposase [Pseudoroseomonas wenyumeiae]
MKIPVHRWPLRIASEADRRRPRWRTFLDRQAPSGTFGTVSQHGRQTSDEIAGGGEAGPAVDPWRHSLGRCHARAHYQHLHRTMEAIIWRCQKGAKWRALPAEYGPWWMAAQTFIRWGRHGVWERLLDVVREIPALSSNQQPCSLVCAKRAPREREGWADG